MRKKKKNLPIAQKTSSTSLGPFVGLSRRSPRCRVVPAVVASSPPLSRRSRRCRVVPPVVASFPPLSRRSRRCRVVLAVVASFRRLVASFRRLVASFCRCRRVVPSRPPHFSVVRGWLSLPPAVPLLSLSIVKISI
jgi:hypothetical protein